MAKLIPFGYTCTNALTRLDELMRSDERTLLIDIRSSPCSRFAEWRREALVQRYRDRYRYAGALLGNVHYKDGGPITIAEPEQGVAKLLSYLDAAYDLILLCGCRRYETCHRRVVCELVRKQLPEVEIVQPDSTSTTGMIRCLSIRQPFASWLARPEWFTRAGLPPKTIENRDWSTGYRGPLLLHAGATFEDDAIDYWREWIPGLERAIPMHKHDYPTKAIIGIAQLVDVVNESEDVWFCGEYGFVLAEARAIGPIPYRGQLRLFEIPVDILPETF